MKKLQFSLLLLLFSNFIFAQLPDSDIWVLDMKDEGGKISFSNPINITNRVGYDNQPTFSKDGKTIYYTCIKEDDQADIYQYDINLKTTKQFTKTPTSEYSPMVTPDGKYISVVMVEKDSAQRIWKFPIKRKEKESLVAENIDSVGYYCWVDEGTIAAFILGEPTSLTIFKIKNQEKTWSASKNIGRTFYAINRNHLVYMAKYKDSNQIRSYKSNFTNSYESSGIIETTGDGEDFCMYKDNFLMCNKSDIYLSDIKNEKWTRLDYFSKYGIENITRIAISPKGDKIAVVSNK